MARSGLHRPDRERSRTVKELRQRTYRPGLEELESRLAPAISFAAAQLFALAYNLANFLRQLVLPRPIRGWTLTTLREKLIKIGAKVVRHSNYVLFQLAEVAVPRKLFARILGRIARLCPACASG
jgi:hypothetical protein